MGRKDYIYQQIVKKFKKEATTCQDGLFRELADFWCCDDADILVVSGYAGTGKTTAMGAIISALDDNGIKSCLLAPTGRSAKVFSNISNSTAYTIHKHIYRQKSVGKDGFGQFTLAPNKAKYTLFVVDEVSLIGIDSAERQSSALFGSGNLLEDLISFVREGKGCKLILIGDPAQLPPVGLDASPALSSSYMDAFGGVRYVNLSTVVRQASESGILVNATILRKRIEESRGDESFDDVQFELGSFEDIGRINGSELIEALSDAYSKYGEDETVVLCRSNKRAIRYNRGIRSTVQFKEEGLVGGDKLMIVKNCYQFLDDIQGLDFIANGDIAKLLKIGHYEERYGLHFADAHLAFPDYGPKNGDVQIKAKLCLDALESESAALSYEQQNALYEGVSADYADLRNKKKIWQAVREDKYFNALQIKYAQAITCHKSQGGQWKCVFIDCPFWLPEQSLDDLKWLYTALTRAVEKVYLVNFKDRFFK